MSWLIDWLIDWLDLSLITKVNDYIILPEIWVTNKTVGGYRKGVACVEYWIYW